jgi:3',5'-cyclic AMP phosphodiesterase CpdA
MTLLAQLSDPHIVPPGRRPPGGVDTPGLLALAVQAVLNLRPLPDAVLVTGDLADAGHPQAYERLLALLRPLPMPVLLMPGNHDSRDALRAACGARAGEPSRLWAGLAPDPGPGQPLDAAVEIGALRLLLLDSSVPGRPEGALTAAQLQWLDRSLGERPHQPTLVAVHHPPFDSGIAFMDAMRLHEGADGLSAVLQRHPQVERLLCGHLHRLVMRRWGGTLAVTAPSTAHQLLLDLRTDGDAALTQEPPGLLLHHWRDGCLLTHRVHSGEPLVAQAFDD